MAAMSSQYLCDSVHMLSTQFLNTMYKSESEFAVKKDNCQIISGVSNFDLKHSNLLSLSLHSEVGEAWKHDDGCL